MELLYCKRDVVKKLNDYVEVHPPVILFKSGNLYPVHIDVNHNWIATDEEGRDHMVAERAKNISDDYWFQFHFEVRT